MMQVINRLWLSELSFLSDTSALENIGLWLPTKSHKNALAFDHITGQRNRKRYTLNHFTFHAT